MIKILTVCGNGIGSSLMCAMKIEEICKEEGIEADVSSSDFNSVAGKDVYKRQAKRRGKKGLFELAHKGTIFLDEISEIPYHLQNKFLRVLQEKCFRRVGGEETIYVDCLLYTYHS